MRLHGLRARHKRRYKQTTDSSHKHEVAPNLLNRQFKQERPNRVWTSDITFIATQEGWLYLAVVMDLFNRQILGWSMKTPTSSPMPCVWRTSSVNPRRASDAVRRLLSEYALQASMSRKGNCWDNAPTESFFNYLKNERVYSQKLYATHAQAQSDVFEYIEVFYNRKRLHSTLNYRSPLQHWENWRNKQSIPLKQAA